VLSGSEEINMQEMLRDIIAALFGNDAEIKISEKVNENGTIILELAVAKENMGKIIGKNGRIANAVRTVMKACASKDNLRVFVQIVDNDSIILI
jgi:predicted RNA-binding protein YlqC (UPF0109 family)